MLTFSVLRSSFWPCVQPFLSCAGYPRLLQPIWLQPVSSLCLQTQWCEDTCSCTQPVSLYATDVCCFELLPCMPQAALPARPTFRYVILCCTYSAVSGVHWSINGAPAVGRHCSSWGRARANEQEAYGTPIYRVRAQSWYWAGVPYSWWGVIPPLVVLALHAVAFCLHRNVICCWPYVTVSG